MRRSPNSIVKQTCARWGCKKLATYEKPLCYEHWLWYDRWEIFECERCHRFDEMVGEFTEEDLCWECVDRERRGFPRAPVQAHAPVSRRIRYLYILKLSDGTYYVGQTNDLALRIAEHRDGQTKTTAGRQPRFVWFEQWVGDTKELNVEEARLTKQAKDNPRAIRRMVANWQQPLRLVEIDA